MKLITIAPGRQLEELAAYSYMRCLIAGIPEGVTSAYRTPEQQQALVDRYNAGTGNYALPPSESEHVKGRALDLPWGAGAREWMRAHGAEHGWFPVTNEKHHFNYLPNLDTHQGEDMFTDRHAATLNEIREAQSTMNARQIIMLREQRAQQGITTTDLNAATLAAFQDLGLADVIASLGLSSATADAIVDRMVERMKD